MNGSKKEKEKVKVSRQVRKARMVKVFSRERLQPNGKEATVMAIGKAQTVLDIGVVGNKPYLVFLVMCAT